jgi:hypothetical protein
MKTGEVCGAIDNRKWLLSSIIKIYGGAHAGMLFLNFSQVWFLCCQLLFTCNHLLQLLSHPCNYDEVFSLYGYGQCPYKWLHLYGLKFRVGSYAASKCMALLVFCYNNMLTTVLGGCKLVVNIECKSLYDERSHIMVTYIQSDRPDHNISKYVAAVAFHVADWLLVMVHYL